MSKLSDNLKTLRMIYGYSVRQVAQKIDRSASSLSNWENEKQLPDTESLEKLCHVYKVTPNEILDWEPCRIIKEFQRFQAENIQKRNKLIEQRKALDEQIKEVERVMVTIHTASGMPDTKCKKLRIPPSDEMYEVLDACTSKLKISTAKPKSKDKS